MTEQESQPSSAFLVGQDLDWSAPWVEVTLCVELPFWLLVDNMTVLVEVAGHEFPVSIHGETFELHIGEITDSKCYVFYHGSLRKRDELSNLLPDILGARPGPNFLWRKCKTVLKIVTRCNEDVWAKATQEGTQSPSATLYLEELCRAHIPVINKVVQQYRLATYDHYPFELAPWDVPYWLIERAGSCKSSSLVNYRRLDHRMYSEGDPGDRPQFISVIGPDELRSQMDKKPTPGEFELLDAINFMERGNFSDAVRRITTAIEVVVEAKVGDLIEKHEGRKAAQTFLNDTQRSFGRRVARFEGMTGRKLRVGLRSELNQTRILRHRIVHDGYRINAGEQGPAQRAVDTGHWIFSWFENDPERQAARNARLGFYGVLGQNRTSGICNSEITVNGVVLSPRRL